MLSVLLESTIQSQTSISFHPMMETFQPNRQSKFRKTLKHVIFSAFDIPNFIPVGCKQPSEFDDGENGSCFSGLNELFVTRNSVLVF